MDEATVNGHDVQNLQAAARAGDVEELRRLLNRGGADLFEAQDEQGQTALMVAVV
eukprot:SAG31_NODE_12670_length_925_cov_1.675545_2_plen_54_part_01